MRPARSTRSTHARARRSGAPCGARALPSLRRARSPPCRGAARPSGRRDPASRAARPRAWRRATGSRRRCRPCVRRARVRRTRCRRRSGGARWWPRARAPDGAHARAGGAGADRGCPLRACRGTPPRAAAADRPRPRAGRCCRDRRRRAPGRGRARAAHADPRDGAWRARRGAPPPCRPAAQSAAACGAAPRGRHAPPGSRSGRRGSGMRRRNVPSLGFTSSLDSSTRIGTCNRWARRTQRRRQARGSAAGGVSPRTASLAPGPFRRVTSICQPALRFRTRRTDCAATAVALAEADAEVGQMTGFGRMLLLGALVVGLASPALAVTYQVNAAAACPGSGTAAAPYCTIGNAAAVAVAGDVIQVAGGIYREQVTPPTSGSAGLPITYRGAAGARILGTNSLTGAGLWTLYAGSTYSTPYNPPTNPAQVFVDGVGLALAASKDTVSAGGFFFDTAAVVLYVNLGGDNPGSHAVEAGARSFGFSVDGKSYLVIEGFEVSGHNTNGIRARTVSNVVIRNNRVLRAAS